MFLKLDEELIQKNHEITKLRGNAAIDMSQLEARSAKNQTSFNKVKRDLDE